MSDDISEQLRILRERARVAEAIIEEAQARLDDNTQKAQQRIAEARGEILKHMPHETPEVGND